MQHVTIEWKKYGSLRDVFVFGEYAVEGLNEVPMLYATAVSRKRYKSAIDDLQAWQKELESAQQQWKKDDGAIVKDTLDWRDFKETYTPVPEKGQLLLYIGYASTLIAVRLVDSYDAGAAIPLFFLNIPATEVDVLVGHITKPDKPTNPLQISEFYKDVESELIKSLNPPLNEKDKKLSPSGKFAFHHVGTDTDLFNS